MRLLISLALIVICTEANAAYSAFGISDLSCGKYIDEITRDEKTKTIYSWWLAGFITGTNLIKNRSISTDPAGYEAWVKKYCDEHPLEPFQKAVIELNRELEKMKQ